MDNRQLAERVAEEIFRVIEREKRIIKADLVEAVEKVMGVTLRTTVEQPELPFGPTGIGSECVG